MNTNQGFEPALETQHNTRHKSLNGVATRAIRAGLNACGWDSEALSKPTRLTDSINLYKDEPNPPETSISDDIDRPSQKRSADNDDHRPLYNSKYHKKNPRQATKTNTMQRRNSIENHARPQIPSVESFLHSHTITLAELTLTQSANQGKVVSSRVAVQKVNKLELNSPISNISMQALVTAEQLLHSQGMHFPSSVSVPKHFDLMKPASDNEDNTPRKTVRSAPGQKHLLQMITWKIWTVTWATHQS